MEYSNHSTTDKKSNISHLYVGVATPCIPNADVSKLGQPVQYNTLTGQY